MSEVIDTGTAPADANDLQAAAATPDVQTPPAVEPLADTDVEAELQAKGKNGPRVTPDDIEANIKEEHYFTAAEGAFGAAAIAGAGSVSFDRSLQLLTFCVLVLQNGYTVVGKSACAAPENFDREMGARIARQDALHQVWGLMGYELRSKLVAMAAAAEPTPPVSTEPPGR